MLGKNSRGSRSCKLNTRGMKNWRFSINISVYFENGTRYGHSYNVTMDGLDEWELVCDLSNGAISSDLE